MTFSIIFNNLKVTPRYLVFFLTFPNGTEIYSNKFEQQFIFLQENSKLNPKPKPTLNCSGLSIRMHFLTIIEALICLIFMTNA